MKNLMLISLLTLTASLSFAGTYGSKSAATDCLGAKVYGSLAVHEVTDVKNGKFIDTNWVDYKLFDARTGALRAEGRVALFRSKANSWLESAGAALSVDTTYGFVTFDGMKLADGSLLRDELICDFKTVK